MNHHDIVTFLKLYLPLLIIIGTSIAMGFVLHYMAYRSFGKYFSQKPNSIFYNFFNQMRGPLSLILPLLFITIATSFLDLSRAANIIGLIVKLLVITATSWSLIKLIDYSDTWVIAKQRENFNRVAAKFYLLKKLVKIIVIFLAISFFLMNFEGVKEVGRGLILSASVVGGIILFAAQGILSNIISGFQLTFTRPLNIGDELLINGEFGTVEEVTLTNVVVKIWDLRRLVVPSSYFIDKPYENWTHPTRDLIGIVFLYTDYNVEIEKLRIELQLILHTTPLWDGKVGKIEVTDLTERAMQSRILASARNAGDVWQLRCYVREKLVEYLYKNFPQSLPKMHADIHVDEETALHVVNKQMSQEGKI